MVVTLDGEQIVKLKPVFGYLHRNHEKIAEGTSYLGSMPYTDRLDYLCSMTTNWAYALAVEKLSGQAVPDRAQYLRIIMAELTRLVNHSCLVGFLFNDLGTSFTPLLYAFDPTPEWLAAASALVDNFPRFLDEYETMLTGNEIMLARTQGIGRLDPQRAINAGITGPILRASGVDYDIRKVDGTGFYSRFDFRVPLGAHGDTYDRYMMRILEMRESVKILQQAFKTLPGGPVMDPKAKLRGFRPKTGEVYGRLESPKGELGFYLISDGSPNPWRYRVRPPSLINLTLLEEMCLGHTIADSVVILGSIDIVLGEVDR
jgi:NADH-quinone oxidoreductase subunit D